MKPIVSIIYCYYNTPKELVISINSLKKASRGVSFEVIIIDNASSLPIPKKIQKLKNVKIVINKKNIGYGAGLNKGTKLAKGKYFLLVNPDTIFLENSMQFMVKKLIHHAAIGILGPQILDKNYNIQKMGSDYPFLPEALFAFSFMNKLFPDNYFSRKYFLSSFDRKQEKVIPVISGACMILPRIVFEKIKGFDTQFFMYFEESDLCYRIKKAGHKVLYYPKAKIIHLGARSTQNRKLIQKRFEESRYKFFKKYHNMIVAFLAEYFLRITTIAGKFL